MNPFSAARFQSKNGIPFNALGFDLLIAILCNTPSIRDVIAFPKTAKGTCLMTDSPSTVEPKQLRDLHIELKVKQPPPAPAPKA